VVRKTCPVDFGNNIQVLPIIKNDGVLKCSRPATVRRALDPGPPDTATDDTAVAPVSAPNIPALARSGHPGAFLGGSQDGLPSGRRRQRRP